MPTKGKKSETKSAAKPVSAKQQSAENTFINRELSWLAFNQRVLLEAADKSVPLLERLKFLMIFQSNQEEFFRVRMGILMHRSLLEPENTDTLTGMRPDEQIREVLKVTKEQQTLTESVWKGIREELKANGVDVLDFKKISKVDDLMSKKLFGDMKNTIVPTILDINQPLPFLWGEESYVIAFLGRNTEQKLAVIPLNRLPGYLTFEIDGCQKIVLTSQLILHFLPLLLKKETVMQSCVVKVTRNADVFLSNVEMRGTDDLRQKMSSLLTKRKREMPVRVQIYGKLTDQAKSLLLKKLRVPERFVFTPAGPFDLSFRSCIEGHAGFRYEPRKPVRDIGLKKGDYFRYIEKQDLLMSFPFQSMQQFVDLIYEAADDPEVLSIKITLYRMSASSKVAAALAYAADRGKDVLCLLELRARFDEQNNIDYSEMLEDAGCRIIYGLPEYKVHSKLCVITRSHDGNLSHITQVGTGNYNEITGEQYTDLSLITSDEEAALDAEAAFTALISGELPPEAKKLWIAPLSFKSRVMELLDEEIAKGSEGRVAIKVNAMNNPDVMQKLIECSQAGVKVELFIRGICCLRPGIPGKTENITVTSVVGRWLEHSRIYKFGEGDTARIFIGSGDLLNRNLERRVEAFAEVITPFTREQINAVLDALRNDREKSRRMLPDGSYIREEGGEGTSSQEALYRYFSSIHVSPDGDEPEEKSEVKAEPAEVTLPQAEEKKPVEPSPEVATDAVPEVEKVPEVPEAQTEKRDISNPVSQLNPVSVPIQIPESKPASTQKQSLFGKIIHLFRSR
ncbi:MAG: polyphosphate kinase 1 [Oscillospiraceae bacterium]|nr:polyphosphate kinase 1 [Oscillospiraceae bacterium]